MLKFNKQLHEYRYNGVKIPSVTQIIENVGLSDFSCINRRVLEIAQERGTFVHLACELFDKGVLDKNTIDSELVGYVDGWMAFCRDFTPVWLAIEKRVYSPLGYAGMLDRKAKIKRSNIILDIKTGGKSKAHEVQLGAYSLIEKCSKVWSLYLPGNGKYKIEENNMQRGQKTFLHALAIYQFKNRSN